MELSHKLIISKVFLWVFSVLLAYHERVYLEQINNFIFVAENSAVKVINESELWGPQQHDSEEVYEEIIEN